MRPRSTGVGFYNSGYRNFNRGFGHLNAKSFQNSHRQHSPQRICQGDLFIEAGRLAVEYLVSHGLLPSNVVSGKKQNGTLKNYSVELKDNGCLQDREYSPVRSRSVAVAVANQGASSPDRFSGSRKSLDDDDLRMVRKSSRERGRYGPSRSYSSDWSRENGRAGSLSDIDRFLKDTAKGGDTDLRISHSVGSASKDCRDNKLVDEMKRCHSDVDSESKMTSMPRSADDKETLKHSDMMVTGCKERKDGSSNVDMNKETLTDELDVLQCEDKIGISSKDGIDLLKLCSTANIPTKLRSSLTNKNLKSDPVLFGEEENPRDPRHVSLDSTNNIAFDSSSEIPSSDVIPSSNHVGTTQPEYSFRDGRVLDHVDSIHQQKPADLVSFTDRTFSYENKSSELPESGRHSSFAEDRGEKRALEEEISGEGAKKAKQWLSVARSDEYSQLSDSNEKQSILPASSDATIDNYNSANQENFTDVLLPLKGGVESAVDQEEVKQLFSSSFKICDLNLMEASDMHSNHDVHTLMYPSISASSKDASVGIDLSLNNHHSLNNGFNDCGSAGKDIEIIDLESASLQEDKNMPGRSMEADITSMGTFPCNSQNSIVNPDGQDGYEFMISDLLGNEDPNCSSVSPNINPLHNVIDLHHGQGMFSEDDPIYMSLGEIPISLLRVWEQPAEERNPFGL